jgi:hypothetical protein
MKSTWRFRFMVLLVCATLLIGTASAKADTIQNDAHWVIAGIVIASAAIAVVVVLVIKRPPSIKGCAVSNQSSLELQNEGDQQTYTLIGDTAKIQSGERVRVTGKKKKKDGSGKQTFVVEKLAKNYGACKVLPAAL